MLPDARCALRLNEGFMRCVLTLLQVRRMSQCQTRACRIRFSCCSRLGNSRTATLELGGMAENARPRAKRRRLRPLSTNTRCAYRCISRSNVRIETKTTHARGRPTWPCNKPFVECESAGIRATSCFTCKINFSPLVAQFGQLFTDRIAPVLLDIIT